MGVRFRQGAKCNGVLIAVDEKELKLAIEKVKQMEHQSSAMEYQVLLSNVEQIKLT